MKKNDVLKKIGAVAMVVAMTSATSLVAFAGTDASTEVGTDAIAAATITVSATSVPAGEDFEAWNEEIPEGVEWMEKIEMTPAMELVPSQLAETVE